MDIAAEIRAELARQKKSYSDLAHALGSSKQAVSKKIGTNQTAITVSDLQQIANALNVPATELLHRAEQEATA